MNEIDIRIEGRAGRITLQRPKALNALTYEMVLQIERALDAWRTDNAVTVISLDAEGEKAFCAGGDQTVRANDGGYQRDVRTLAGRAGSFRRFQTD